VKCCDICIMCNGPIGVIGGAACQDCLDYSIESVAPPDPRAAEIKEICKALEEACEWSGYPPFFVMLAIVRGAEEQDTGLGLANNLTGEQLLTRLKEWAR